MLAVLAKEFRSYFLTPLGYIFMGSFLTISGIIFTVFNLIPASSNYYPVLSNLIFIFLIAVPILTMRLISEENRQKTDQLLLTCPLKVSDIVVGKYLAAVAVFLLTIVITFLYPVIMSWHGFISLSEICGGYIGFFLLGASFIAVGLFVSALTDNQVSAAVITFGALLLIWLADSLQQVLPSDTLSGLIFAALILIGLALLVRQTTRNPFAALGTAVLGALIIGGIYAINSSLYDGLIVKVCSWFSLLKRYQDFANGLVTLSSIIYFLSFIFAFLFLTTQTIAKRRWN
jgi:ABC-2 type transport system permease protein